MGRRNYVALNPKQNSNVAPMCLRFADEVVVVLKLIAYDVLGDKDRG